MPFKAWFIDAPLEEFDYVEQTLMRYDIGEYAIGHEKVNSKGEEKPHYHFFVEIENKDYNSYIKLINKRIPIIGSGKGGKRKYGAVKDIRDLNKMLSYTIKDNNYRSNMEADRLKEAFEKSFPKKDIRTELDKLKTGFIEYVTNHVNADIPLKRYYDKETNIKHLPPKYTLLTDTSVAVNRLRSRAIEYLVQEEIPIKSRNQIESYTLHYAQHTKDIEIIKFILFKTT